MGEYFTRDDFQRAAEVIAGRTPLKPTVGMILGSGLGPLAQAIETPVRIPFGEIPGWPTSTVEGHAGSLVIGTLEGHGVAVLQGRVHYYEGYTMAQIGLPIRTLQMAGVDTFIITNAAGGVNPEFHPGDVMLITDHLNLIGMAGLSPLRGPNDDRLGPRFPDMSRAYNRGLMALARRAADVEGIRLREGVYVCLAGPAFETPADLRFLRMAGADAVGMSTVPEVVAAHHGGSRVLGFSGISNKANLDGTTVTTHEEVLAAGKEIAPKLERLVRGVLRGL
ncbi:MAG TPA: purine-nucleoside phosphorylase [Anaerolineales bacterium]|nr:purine-nucleoside phosphorylase [Anaerolineales bacterium]